MVSSCFVCKGGFETDQIIRHPCENQLQEKIELLFHEKCAKAYHCPYCHFDVQLSLKDKYLLATLTSLGFAATYGVSLTTHPNNGFISGACATLLGTVPLFFQKPRKGLISLAFLISTLSFIALSTNDQIDPILTGAGALFTMLSMMPTLRLASWIPPHEMRMWPFFAVASSALATLAMRSNPYSLAKVAYSIETFVLSQYTRQLMD